MVRVRLWLSAVRDVNHALVIHQAGAADRYFALRCPESGLEWLGAGYRSSLFGFEGTSFDLPRGFPSNNADAALRLNDPSISNAMKSLIRLNFPLKERQQPVARPRLIA